MKKFFVSVLTLFFCITFSLPVWSAGIDVIKLSDWISADPVQCKKSVGTANPIILQVREVAETCYPSKYEPWTKFLNYTNPGFDPLKTVIEDAHTRGVKVYAYINVFPVSYGDTIPPQGLTPGHMYYSGYNCYATEKGDPWGCVSKNLTPVSAPLNGSKYFYVSPGIPAAQQHIKKVILEIVDSYNIDGIILNELKYPAQETSPDPVSKERFFARGNLARRDWDDWQREQLTRFITNIYAEVKNRKPEVTLSVTAAGLVTPYFEDEFYNTRIPSGYYDYYQDPAAWITRGIVDTVYSVETINNKVLKYFDSNILNKNHGYNLASYAMIKGVVKDETGQLVTDASVSLCDNIKGNTVSSTVTSMDGTYAFVKVSTSTEYRVIAEYDGADSVEVSSITLSSSEIREVGLTIQGVDIARQLNFVHIFDPVDNSEVNTGVIHILGRTIPGYTVMIGTVTTQVFPTGAFAVDGVRLSSGINQIPVTVTTPQNVSTTRIYRVSYINKEKAGSDKEAKFRVLEPSGDVAVYTGKDAVEFKLDGPSGYACRAVINGDKRINLTEVAGVDKIKSVYYAKYVPFAGDDDEDDNSAQRVVFETTKGKKFCVFSSIKKMSTDAKIEIWPSAYVRIAETVDDKTPVVYGLHDVRLGGPYIAELPKGTRFVVLSRKGEMYNINLSKSLSGWVSVKSVKLLPPSTPVPHNYFTYCSAGGNEDSDFVWIQMSAPVAYAVKPEPGKPNKIVIDFFDTHNATTWITHKASATVIDAVICEQVEDNLDRISVVLNTNFIWGYRAEKIVRGGVPGLMLYIKRPPKGDSLKIIKNSTSPVNGLIIAIEAGHGGPGSTGAVGLMGFKEKDVNLYQVGVLKQILESRGAKVVLMRPGDTALDFSKKLQYASDGKADLILTIHSNAGGNAVGFNRRLGTSTYYKYLHCKPLAEFIWKELLNLGELGDFGLVGNFNYSPLRDTRIPAMLVEQAFMTDPYEEALLVDKEFHKRQAEAVICGLEKFLISLK
ncbi:MAG: family 10 glycosylhydrolase [Elusimicrobiota bacterium]